ncbi:Aspartate aminotransferase [Limihaloglobus sulfuriphilus]|uniref:Aminotransferase n=1 Tax=Limihaloglobus sulfuriphilus TaxID=1851148 RepID=A0A1Q2MER8_9BACT|nr:pyridoxal phosphate-dependent aminotransferase [Limihaloglobus sulfuriphilus]AQQ70787.1 Aspartate aminotransferase [Limihaloglobus sulfuriphilus]
MKISQRAQAVPASATMLVATRAKEMKAQGIDVVSYGAGEPDFDTPQYIKDAAIKAINDGKTGYTATPGIPELKKAICEKLKAENNLDYTPEQIICNIGAKHSIYEAFQAILDDGDEVIMPAPYWVTYPEAIKLAGGTPKVINGDPSNSYKVTPEQLKNALTDKTAAFLLNSPNNPGGFCYTPDELKELAKVLEGTNVTVVSDEIYERLVYGNTQFISFAALSDDAFSRTITINGFSKAFAMTGWRLGYTAGPLQIIKAMGKLQSHMTQNPVSFVQYAAVEALKDPDGVVEQMRLEFEKRGGHMSKRLKAIEGFICPEPTGAFYCFPDVSHYYGKTIGGVEITDSMTFAQTLLEQANVAIVPGGAFGCDNNVRLSFACSMEQIDKGIDRIQDWLKS